MSLHGVIDGSGVVGLGLTDQELVVNAIDRNDAHIDTHLERDGVSEMELHQVLPARGDDLFVELLWCHGVVDLHQDLNVERQDAARVKLRPLGVLLTRKGSPACGARAVRPGVDAHHMARDVVLKFFGGDLTLHALDVTTPSLESQPEVPLVEELREEVVLDRDGDTVELVGSN